MISLLQSGAHRSLHETIDSASHPSVIAFRRARVSALSSLRPSSVAPFLLKYTSSGVMLAMMSLRGYTELENRQTAASFEDEEDFMWT